MRFAMCGWGVGRIIARLYRRKLELAGEHEFYFDLIELEQYDQRVFFSVDPASSVPLFAQLGTGIRGQIIAGNIEAGERLPAARQLAESLDINVHTVLRAYQELRDEGFIELRRGRGAVVTDRTQDYRQLTSDIDRLVIEAKKLELTPGALGDLIRQAWE